MTASVSESFQPAILTRPERSQRTAELFESIVSERDAARRQDLLNEVVVLNMRVAKALAQRFSNRGVDADDLVQVASIGLVKAAERFEPAMGKDFLSFAVPTIRGELQRHFRDAGWVVRPTRRIQEARWRIAKVEAELTQSLGHVPSAEEVRTELDMSYEEYAEASSANGCFRPTSLDQPVSVEGDGTSLGDLLPADGHELSASEARMALAPVIRKLSERDRQVVHLRFFEDMGQREIGLAIGVTQTQVSRILDRILADLHHYLTAAPGAGVEPQPAA